MKFYQRLAYYLLGFLIGCVAIYYIFKGRNQEFNYMPNARVLSSLRSKPMKFSARAQQEIDAKLIDTAMISKSLHYGDVDFGKSNVKVGGGKLYIVEGKNAQGQKIILEFINYDDRAELRDIHK